MIYIYIAISYILYPFIHFFSIFNKRAWDFLYKRKVEKQEILSMEPISRKVIWLHAASVGELDQCKALAKTIKENEPETIIIQSVFSESVKDNNLNSPHVTLHFHLPLDFYFAYDFIFEKFHPVALVIMAWDTWPNLVMTAKRNKCKVYLACGTYSRSSGRNSFLMRLLTSEVFSKFDGISPANELFERDFLSITRGKIHLKVCGDSRFDSVKEKILRMKPRDDFGKFISIYPYKNIIIFASTYSYCERELFSSLPELIKNGNSIWIFPHKINPSRIEEIRGKLKDLNVDYFIYSQFFQLGNSAKDLPEKYYKVVIFDILGLLAFAYEKAIYAYVGGGMHFRVHNVLEPAYFGLPVITGTMIQNSPEAMLLSEKGGLFTVMNNKEFNEVTEKLKDNSLREEIKSLNTGFVNSGTGASLKFYREFLIK